MAGLADALMGTPQGMTGPIPLASMPTWADAADWHGQNLADTWAAMQNPQTWRDAAQQYGNAMLMGTTAPGIRAFHGSPYSFDRFDASKIGTGEGAQAYGHGLYFAQSEDVARSYKNALTGTNRFGNGYTVPMTLDGQPVTSRNWVNVSNDLAAKGDDQGAYLATVLGDANRYNVQTMGALKKAYADPNHPLSLPYPSPYGKVNNPATLNAVFKDLRKRGAFANPRGSMYEVNIAADPQHFLDWDKPLSEQSPATQDKVRAAVKLAADPRMPLAENGLPRWAADDPNGQQLHTMMAGLTGNDQAKASQALRDAGIPGIRYLDQGSRGAGQGTSNYVVFDPATIEILRKYGIAGLMAGGGAAAATQGNGNAP